MAWHGTSSEKLQSVINSGFANLRSTDGGFFGAGCYFAQEAAYACRYSRFSPPTDDGTWLVILCILGVGCAYPLTPDIDYPNPNFHDHFYSKFFAESTQPAFALQTPCDVHYVPVRRYDEFPHDDYQVMPVFTISSVYCIVFSKCPVGETTLLNKHGSTFWLSGSY